MDLVREWDPEELLEAAKAAMAAHTPAEEAARAAAAGSSIGP